MATNKSVELAHKVVEEGYDKYSQGANFLSPDILMNLVKAYAFDALHKVYEESADLKAEIDFHTFSTTVNRDVEHKLQFHLENPMARK